MPIKAGMISLGCPKNQVDAEVMLATLKNAGMELTPEAGEADVVIINTCGFIEAAKSEAIENILEMAQLKKEGRIRGIVVTGCLAERYRDELRQELPEINSIVPLGASGDIVRAVTEAAGGVVQDFAAGRGEAVLGGERLLTTLPFYAYLKVADGCDNRCSYCVIPSLRGPFRSRPMEELEVEARSLVSRGVKELILVAQDTTRYGQDLYGRLALPELLERLAKIGGIEWLRILYAYPDRVTDALIDVMAREDKVVKYLDIPIQHVSGRILRAMRRRGTKEELAALFAKLRARIPGITLRTTVITGFPGETDAEFEELAQFLADTRFERFGAFAYSQEEGTPAAEMDDQVDADVKLRRQEALMEQQNVVSEEQNRAKVGSTLRVLVEGWDRWAECWFGRTQADAPEIDGKVFFTAEEKPQPGDFADVLVEDVLDYDLTGRAV